MSFNAIRENKILAKISEFTVRLHGHLSEFFGHMRFTVITKSHMLTHK